MDSDNYYFFTDKGIALHFSTMPLLYIKLIILALHFKKTFKFFLKFKCSLKVASS